MGNCIAALKRLKTKLAIDVDYKSMDSIQDSASTVDEVSAIDYTTINTNREFHNEEASTYWLPKDEEEQRRLAGVSNHHCSEYCFNFMHLLLN